MSRLGPCLFASASLALTAPGCESEVEESASSSRATHAPDNRRRLARLPVGVRASLEYDATSCWTAARYRFEFVGGDPLSVNVQRLDPNPTSADITITREQAESLDRSLEHHRRRPLLDDVNGKILVSLSWREGPGVEVKETIRDGVMNVVVARSQGYMILEDLVALAGLDGS